MIFHLCAMTPSVDPSKYDGHSTDTRRSIWLNFALHFKHLNMNSHKKKLNDNSFVQITINYSTFWTEFTKNKIKHKK